MLRVIHSAPTWLPQTQTWMHNQARALPGDVESHVVCEHTENLDAFPMPHVHALASGPRWRHAWDKTVRGLGVRSWLGHLPRVATEIRADVVHSHFGHVGSMDSPAVQRLGVPHVVTFYGQDIGYLPRVEPKWHRLYREMFARVDAVLCEGPHMGSCVEELGCPGEKIRVHPLGVATETIEFRPRRREPDEPFRILIAGSFTEKKGIPDAIDALGGLATSENLAITIIGDASASERNQSEKRRIREAVDRHGLGDRCRWLGYQPHHVLFEQAYQHHVFLSPSVHASDGDTEGGAPVTVAEMAATGMPVVSTTHCDIPFVIEHGVGGLLADEHDVPRLTEHLRELAQQPERWEAMGQAARARIESQFDLSRQGVALADVYRDLV